MFQIAELVATFVETLTGMLIIAKVSEEGMIRQREGTVAAGSLAIVVWILNQYKLFSPLTAAVAIAGFIINAIIIYKTKFAEAILIAVTYIILLYIIDFLSISILGVIFQRERIADILINSFSFERISLIVLTKVLLGLIYIVLERYILCHIYFRMWKAWIMVLIGIGLVYWFINNTLLKADGNMVLTGTLLLILLLLGIYSASQKLSYLREKGEMRVMMERSGLIAEDYKEAVENYRKNQIYYHDLKNQHLIIEGYLKEGRYEKARQYLEELETVERVEPLKRWTGIDVLDILLAYKKKEAETLEIKVDIAAVSIRLDMSDQEITAVVGNAFDNAIEACAKIENEKRWIKIVFRKVREMTFIKITNSCEGKPEVKKGGFLSQKYDKSLHGLGIMSMDRVVNKHDGIMNIKCEEGIFCIEFSFFC